MKGNRFNSSTVRKRIRAEKEQREQRWDMAAMAAVSLNSLNSRAKSENQQKKKTCNDRRPEGKRARNQQQRHGKRHGKSQEQ